MRPKEFWYNWSGMQATAQVLSTLHSCPALHKSLVMIFQFTFGFYHSLLIQLCTAVGCVPSFPLTRSVTGFARLSNCCALCVYSYQSRGKIMTLTEAFGKETLFLAICKAEGQSHLK